MYGTLATPSESGSVQYNALPQQGQIKYEVRLLSIDAVRLSLNSCADARHASLSFPRAAWSECVYSES